MHAFVRHLFFVLLHLGAWGVIILGVLDSSFLFMPLGNDLLIIGLTSQNPKRLALYAPMAALGSVLGCVLLDLIARKEGEEGLRKLVDKKRFKVLEQKIGERAAITLALTCLAPPPFPFTPIVAAASAFQYPRRKMFTVIGAARLVRFTLVGLLAVFFGSRIISIAKSQPFEYAMIALFILFVAGSVMSIIKWLRHARSGRAHTRSQSRT